MLLVWVRASALTIYLVNPKALFTGEDGEPCAAAVIAAEERARHNLNYGSGHSGEATLACSAPSVIGLCANVEVGVENREEAVSCKVHHSNTSFCTLWVLCSCKWFLCSSYCNHYSTPKGKCQVTKWLQTHFFPTKISVLQKYYH